MWETRRAWVWVPAASPGAQQAPTPAPRGPCASPRKTGSAPEAGNGNKTAVREVAHLQREVGQQAGGSHRRRDFLGPLPSCPQSQEQMWAVPGGRVPEKPRSLQATGFQWGEERDGRRRRKERREEGEGGGGRNWETEV